MRPLPLPVQSNHQGHGSQFSPDHKASMESMMSQLEPMTPVNQDQISEYFVSLHLARYTTEQHIGLAAVERSKPVKSPRKKKATSSEAPKSKNKKASPSQNDAKGSDINSDSESSSHPEVEIPDEPSPIPPSRPVEPEGAAEYDTLKAVWSPRNKRPDVQKVKNSLVAFKDVVKSIRDEWKARSQSMKEAENKSELEKSTEFKKQVILQRRLMEIIVNTTLQRGHPVIIEKYVFCVSSSLFLTLCYYRHNYRSLEQIQDILLLKTCIRCYLYALLS